MLTLDRIVKTCVERSLRWHPTGLNEWSLSDWGCALAGEVGEALNVVKKLNRIRDKIIGNAANVDEAALLAQLKDECGDIFAYAILFAVAADIDPVAAIVDKFNAVSERVGFPERLTVNGRGNMPTPEELVENPDGECWAAMFHYCVEGQELDPIAHDKGFSLHWLKMEDDTAVDDDHPAAIAQDKGESAVRLWNPPTPDGWKLGGKWDTEDGPIAVFLEPHASAAAARAASAAAAE